MGRQPDSGRLCPALHRQERTPLVRRPRRQHGAGRDLVPGNGGDRRHHHAELWRHQCDCRHPRGLDHHLLLRDAHCVLCGQVRHRHRPADARSRLRLHRLDGHLADLRVLHLHLLCDRSRDPRVRARNVLRDSAAGRLSHQRRRHHPAGSLWHHADQPLPIVDATAMGDPSHHSVRGDRLAQPALLYGMAQVLGRARRSQRTFRSVAVRRCGLGGVFAGGADRRAGRLPALSPPRPPRLEGLLVDGADERRTGLDRARRAEAPGPARFSPSLRSATACRPRRPPSRRICTSKRSAMCSRSPSSHWR